MLRTIKAIAEKMIREVGKVTNGKPQFSNDELECRFTYHPPKDGQPNTYEAIRDGAKSLAKLINATVPDSREKALALTKLEEAVMWANAGVARRE